MLKWILEKTFEGTEEYSKTFYQHNNSKSIKGTNTKNDSKLFMIKSLVLIHEQIKWK